MKSLPHPQPLKRRCILVCQGRSCVRSGAAESIQVFRQRTSLPVSVVESGCMGLCSVGPNVRVMPDGVSYCRVKADNVPEVITQHIEGDRPIPDLYHPRMHGYAHLAQPQTQLQSTTPSSPAPGQE